MENPLIISELQLHTLQQKVSICHNIQVYSQTTKRMGSCISDSLQKEFYNYVSRDVVSQLNNHSQSLEKQLSQVNSNEKEIKFYMLVDICLKQNQYFYDQLNRLFIYIRLQLPKKFTLVGNKYSSQLSQLLKHFRLQFSRINILCDQQNKEIIFLTSKLSCLDNKIKNKQEPKVPIIINNNQQLERLNKIIQQYQQNQANNQYKIFNLNQAVEKWRNQAITISQINSNLENSRKDFNKKSYEKELRQKMLQIASLQNQIKEYKALIKKWDQNQKQQMKRIQYLMDRQKYFQSTETTQTNYISNISINVENLNNQIQTLKDDKMKLTQEIQTFRRKQLQFSNTINKLNDNIKAAFDKSNQHVISIENHKKKQNYYQQKIQQLNRKMQQLQQQLQQTKKALKATDITPLYSTSINFNIEQYQTNFNSLQSKYNEAQQQIKILKEEKRNQSHSITLLNTAVASSSQIQDQKTINKLKGQKLELQQKVKQQQRRIESLEKQIIFIQQQKRNLVQANDVLEKENQNLYQNRQTLLMENKKLQEERNALLIEKDTRLKEQQNYLYQEKNQQRENQSNLIKLQQKEKSLKVKEQQLNNRQSELSEIERQLRVRDENVNAELDELEFYKIQLKVKQEKLNNMENELKTKQNRLGNAFSMKYQYEGQIKAKDGTIEELQNHSRRLTFEVQQMTIQLNSLTSIKQHQSAQNQQLLKKLKQQQTVTLNLSKDLNNKTKELSEVNKQLSLNFNRSNEVQERNRQISRLKELNVELNQKYSRGDQVFNNEKSSLMNQLIIKQEQLDRVIKQQQTLQIENQENIKSNDNLKKKFYDINKQFQTKCQQITNLSLTAKAASRCFTQYFNGCILNIDTPKDTEWFVNNLEGHLGKRIKATRLLYKMDLQNKVSFHYYIDNKPNIVLLAKMTNGQVIGGYSEPPFKPQTNVDYKPGMMFGFNNRKVFTVKKQPTTKHNKTCPKPITYDEYYIIWGNSDIRIKSGCKEIFSNYSTSNCSYEENGSQNPSISDLFMQTQRDAILVEYELHQVMFENEESYR